MVGFNLMRPPNEALMWACVSKNKSITKWEEVAEEFERNGISTDALSPGSRVACRLSMLPLHIIKLSGSY